MPSAGEERDIWYEDGVRQVRSVLCELWNCPQCAEPIELWAETEAWSEAEDGRWMHAGFGCPMGVCDECHMLVVVQPDGSVEAYALGKPHGPAGEGIQWTE